MTIDKRPEIGFVGDPSFVCRAIFVETHICVI